MYQYDAFESAKGKTLAMDVASSLRFRREDPDDDESYDDDMYDRASQNELLTLMSML